MKLALLQGPAIPRSLSAGRSRSSDQYSLFYGSEDAPKWTKVSAPSGSRSSKTKSKPDFKKSQDSLARDLDLRKKQNLTTTTRPFHFSTDNLLKGGEKVQPYFFVTQKLIYH